MKSGANFEDINKIKALAAEGLTVDMISKRLVILPGVVEQFMPVVAPKEPKPATPPPPKPAPPKG